MTNAFTDGLGMNETLLAAYEAADKNEMMDIFKVLNPDSNSHRRFTKKIRTRAQRVTRRKMQRDSRRANRS